MDKGEILQDISVDLSIMYKKALKNINKLDPKTKKEFAKAFVETEIPNDDYKRAMNNLNREKLNERMQFTPMDGALNFKWQQQQIQNKLYYAGQYAPISLLNPIAWAQFIQAWKRGDFKNK